MGVISINLVRIALESNTIEDFYKLLDEKLDICKEGLLYRINRLLGTKAKVAPILYKNGAMGHYLDSENEVDFLFKKGRASVSLGYIGLHETVLKLTGKKMFGNPEIKQIGIDILQHLRDKCDEWKAETGYGFSLYGTPSENLCYKFERLDREKFGIIEGITDKEWYTNSFHLDVQQPCTAFEKIDFEAPFQKISNGGFITYVECNSLKDNPKALEALWDYAVEKVGYFSINVPLDKCFKCGYDGQFVPTENGFQCPNCGNTDPETISCVRRISGYLTDGRQINKGKFNEIINRVVHY